jgi:hypothetical protein
MRHWEKNQSTLLEISPTGGTQKPAIDRPTPDASMKQAENPRKCKFFIKALN